MSLWQSMLLRLIDVVEERVGVRDKQRMMHSTMPSRVSRRRRTVRAAAGDRRRLSQERTRILPTTRLFDP